MLIISGLLKTLKNRVFSTKRQLGWKKSILRRPFVKYYYLKINTRVSLVYHLLSSLRLSILFSTLSSS